MINAPAKIVPHASIKAVCYRKYTCCCWICCPVIIYHNKRIQIFYRNKIFRIYMVNINLIRTYIMIIIADKYDCMKHFFLQKFH